MDKDNKYIHILEKNLHLLENKNKHYKLSKVNEDLKKQGRISARTMQLFAPYVLSAGVLLGILKFTGNTPFIKDQEKHYSTDIIEMDSNHSYSKTTTHNSISRKSSLFFYYSKWNLVDKVYTREVKKYCIPNYTEEEVANLMNKNISNIEDVLGKPLSITKETTDTISGENKPYLSAIIYTQNSNEYYYIVESPSKDNACTIGYISLLMILFPLISKIRNEKSSFSYINSINSIKLNYQTKEINEKKLTLVKDNLDLLKRS